MVRRGWRHAKRVSQIGAVVGVTIAASFGLLAAYLAARTSSGDARYFATAGWLTVFILPLAVILTQRSAKAQSRSDDVVANLTTQLTEAAEKAGQEAAEREIEANRQQFESRLAKRVGHGRWRVGRNRGGRAGAFLDAPGRAGRASPCRQQSCASAAGSSSLAKRCATRLSGRFTGPLPCRSSGTSTTIL